MPMSQLGPRLREARTRAGLSLRAAARELGVSPSFVSQMENGKSQPSVATLYSLAQLLGVSVDELFAAEAPEPSAEPMVAHEDAAETVETGTHRSADSSDRHAARS